MDVRLEEIKKITLQTIREQEDIDQDDGFVSFVYHRALVIETTEGYVTITLVAHDKDALAITQPDEHDPADWLTPKVYQPGEPSESERDPDAEP